MTRTHLVALVLGLLLPLLCTGALAQDAEPPTKDEQAKAKLEEVKENLKEELTEAKAVESVAKLLAVWDDKEVAEAIRKTVPDLMEKLAKEKDDAVAMQGIGGLARLPADEAAKPLLSLLDKALGAKEPSVDLYGAILRALKQVADPSPKTVKELIKLLRHKNHDVVAKAADCMAGYKDAEGKVRKELLEELIKQTEGVYTSAQNRDQNQERKWNIIQGKVMAALNALSGQTFTNPTEARAWFNDNKKDKDLWK